MSKSAIIELSKSDRGDEVEVKLSEFLFGRYFKVVFIGSALFALQQLSGINAVFYFSSAVFKSAGVPSDSANICVGICNLLGSIIAMIMMDKLGRKVLLTGSFFGMAISMGLQAIAATSFVSSFAALYLSVGGMLLFVLMFSLGAGPVPSLLLSEILPGRIRAKALAVCMAVHWVINFFVGLLFLRLLEQIGPLGLENHSKRLRLHLCLRSKGSRRDISSSVSMPSRQFCLVLVWRQRRVNGEIGKHIMCSLWKPHHVYCRSIIIFVAG
ncbi:hypothetical protein OIU77_023809 [Salix suchowensis]|uniref:Major facilitator superfamily (MFS) profile domain-containing protein n=1 Tax=Salix suchowensis TaxID=1278906 RepID=A0ABQ9C8G1_9ROSI|nr:hypothetical protein OIU77_023809 [Salix suchowensis]